MNQNKRNDIYPFKDRISWTIDKINTIKNNKKIYSIGFTPSFIVFIGLIADAYSILKIKGDLLTYILLISLFLYGIINLVLLFKLGRTQIRLNRSNNNFEFIHQDMIHLFRNYFSEKEYNKMQNRELSISEIEVFIKEIMMSFNKNFMHINHRRETNITLKYLFKGKLYILRDGNNLNNRNIFPENKKESTIYNVIFKKDNEQKILYIKDVNNLDHDEILILGDDVNNLRKRALNKFSTLIAVPLKSGDIRKSDSTKRNFKEIGFISIDLNEKLGFGDLYRHETEIICSFVDMLSIVVNDLIKSRSLRIE